MRRTLRTRLLMTYCISLKIAIGVAWGYQTVSMIMPIPAAKGKCICGKYSSISGMLLHRILNSAITSDAGPRPVFKRLTFQFMSSKSSVSIIYKRLQKRHHGAFIYTARIWRHGLLTSRDGCRRPSGSRNSPRTERNSPERNSRIPSPKASPSAQTSDWFHKPIRADVKNTPVIIGVRSQDSDEVGRIEFAAFKVCSRNDLDKKTISRRLLVTHIINSVIIREILRLSSVSSRNMYMRRFPGLTSDWCRAAFLPSVLLARA